MIKRYSLLLFFFFSFYSFAQEETLSKITVLIESKQYKESISKLIVLENEFPNSVDVKFKLAQVYFWDSDENSAFQKVSEIPLDKMNEEILKLKIQIQQKRKDYLQVIELCKIGNDKFTDKEFYYTQSAIAYAEIDEVDLALESLSKIEKTAENSASIDYLKKEIINKKKNFISVGYLQTNTLNEDFPIWYLTSLEYGHKFKKHTVIGRVNYSFLSNLDAIQYEIDWYPKISKHNYGFISAGFSNDILFPNYKFSGELFHEQNSLTASIGAKTLVFEDSNINILTGHIGYLFNSYKVAYRSYFILQENSKGTFSHLVSFRKKFDEKDTYIQLELIYGNAPYFYYTTSNFSTLANYRVGVVSRFKISNTISLLPNIQYEREEYSPDNFRDKINFQTNLIYTF